MRFKSFRFILYTMPVYSDKIHFATKGNCHIIDITSEINKALVKSKQVNGTVTVFVPGATGAVTTMEYERGLAKDIQEFYDRLIPKDKEYHHNAAWQDGNGHSHVRASCMGPSLAIPFLTGKLTLGTWQQVVFIDFDIRERDREIILQFVGE